MRVLMVLLLATFLQEKGDKAPDFAVKNQAGKEIKLSEFKDKKHVLLAFYPRDFTGGWTKEVQELRDSIKKFEDKSCVVFGISTDGADSHKKFCDEQKLPFDLLADTDKKAHEAYGFKGPVRATFLVGKDGTLRYANRKFGLNPDTWKELYKAVEALEK